MFRIGERVVDGKEPRRRTKGRGVNDGDLLHNEGLRDVAAKVTFLSRSLTDLHVKGNPSRRRYRASRHKKQGDWVLKREKDPKQTPIDMSSDSVCFTVGQSGSKSESHRYRLRRKQVPAESAAYFFPTYTLDRENPVHDGQPSEKQTGAGPSEDMAEKLKEEYAQRSELLKAEGNEALRNGDYVKAKELYSEGLRLVMGNFPGCKQLMSKLLSNRAAAHIYLSDLDSALRDCKQAQSIHPKNIRAYLRTATCRTLLGEFHEAQVILERALEMLSASDPQYKTASDQLKCNLKYERMFDEVAVRCAAADVDDDLLKSVQQLCVNVKHCEKVWRLAALIYLQMKNFGKLDAAITTVKGLFKLKDADGLSGVKRRCCWWQWIRTEAAWWNPAKRMEHLFDEILELQSAMVKTGVKEFETTPETADLTADRLNAIVNHFQHVSDLNVQAKEAFCQKRYGNACDLYSKAIALCEQECGPVAVLSMLYCNRAAAMHGRGIYIEALADVCTALSLNPLYVKAYLRLVQMYVEVRNSSAASEALAELESKQLKIPPQELERLKQLKAKVNILEENDASRIDAYKLLGLAQTCETTEVKKVFKRLALKLHPDKASTSVKLKLTWMQTTTEFVKRTEKDIRDRLHDHMQHLFKQLNAAHGVLINVNERRKLDKKLQRAAEAEADHRPRHDNWYTGYSADPFYHRYHDWFY